MLVVCVHCLGLLHRYPVAVDEGKIVSKAFPTLTIPHTFVVGGDGVIAWHGLCIDVECTLAIQKALSRLPPETIESSTSQHSASSALAAASPQNERQSLTEVAVVENDE